MRASLNTQAHYLQPRGLHQATFWVGLRQEIHLAIIHQRPIGFYPADCSLDRSISPADDQLWIHRIILHLVDVIEYCFGETNDPAIYDDLVNYSAAWMTSKPDTFAPAFFRHPRDGEIFPRILFLSDTIAAALQYYYLVRILLTAHNPKIPRLGNSQKVAWQSTDVSTFNGICPAS
jgi:hypothetical protein